MLKAVVVGNLFPVMDMPPVQLLRLLSSREEELVNVQLKLKSNIVNAALDKVGGELQITNIPQKVDLMNASLLSPIYWNAVNDYMQFENQPEDSYH
eukprot:13847564-Ditylum_brightwellii.AAC.1